MLLSVGRTGVCWDCHGRVDHRDVEKRADLPPPLADPGQGPPRSSPGSEGDTTNAAGTQPWACRPHSNLRTPHDTPPHRQRDPSPPSGVKSKLSHPHGRIGRDGPPTSPNGKIMKVPGQVSQRSTSLAGAATVSVANGSGIGVRSSSPSALARTPVRSPRWMCGSTTASRPGPALAGSSRALALGLASTRPFSMVPAARSHENSAQSRKRPAHPNAVRGSADESSGEGTCAWRWSVTV